MKVKDCMCKEVTYLAPENTVLDCAKKMSEEHIGCVPVCDSNKKIVGIVTDRDIILRTVACNKDASQTQICEIMTTKVCSCMDNDEVSKAENAMSNEQIRRLPVINESNEIVGMVTLKDLCINENLNNTSIGQTLENICNCDKKNAE